MNILMSKLGTSPTTTVGGFLCLIGTALVLVGLFFKESEVWTSGLALIGTGASVTGLAARDNTTTSEQVKAVEKKKEEPPA